MHPIISLIFCLAFISLAWSWQQSETEEYNEDSLPPTSNSWKGGNIEKRNTWWTKKSVHDDRLLNDMMNTNQVYAPLKAAGVCFMGRCTLMFAECLRQADSKAVYMRCKDSHFLCLSGCLRENRERLMNNAPMTS